MADYFLGEIRLFSMSFAPKNWAICNGQPLSVTSNQALFALLGTTYGGNGTTTFNLPDLRGKVPIGVGAGGPQPVVTLGQTGGEELHTLSTNELPTHVHSLGVNASNPGSGNSNAAAGGNTLGQSGAFGSLPAPIAIYNSAIAPPVQVASGMIGNNGGSGPHENRQPYLPLNYCIALSGMFPPRN